MKFVDAYRARFEAYAREGLEQAKRAGAKKFRVDWGDGPFFCRAYNLARYGDDDAQPYEDGLELPEFPREAVRALAEANPEDEPFFTNEDEVAIYDEEEGWDAAFDCGPYMEAGEWVKLMVDDSIRAIGEKLASDPASQGIQVELCGNDGLFPLTIRDYTKEIREQREERDYRVEAELVKRFIALFTDKPDTAWLKAAAKL
jgi:hypothetical protein